MAITQSVIVQEYTSAERDGLTTSLWNCGLCSIPHSHVMWSGCLSARLAIMSEWAAVMWSPFTILLCSTCFVLAPTSPPMLCGACLQSLLSHLCSELPAHSPCQPACIQKHCSVAPANCLQLAHIQRLSPMAPVNLSAPSRWPMPCGTSPQHPPRSTYLPTTLLLAWDSCPLPLNHPHDPEQLSLLSDAENVFYNYTA